MAQLSGLCFMLLLILLLFLPSTSPAQTGPPVIQTQPQSTNVPPGATAFFKVAAVGATPLNYQWFRSTGPISRETNAILRLVGVTATDAGPYVVKVTNFFGMATSMVAILSVTPMDFGDAPPPYPTLFRDDGARHPPGQGVFLGNGVSFEPDGQPDPAANGDSFDDGVRFPSGLVRGTACPVEVIASNRGFLQGWIDFNGNGDWGDAGEQIFADVVLSPGTNVLTFDLPATLPSTAASTFARFRFSTAPGLRPTGPAPDGEVEDYQVQIESLAADLSVMAAFSPDAIPPNSNGQGLLNVSNAGPALASNVILSNTLSGADIFGVQAGTTGACTVEGGVIVCQFGDMQPRETRAIFFGFRPRQLSIITNVLTARSDVFDPKPSNNRTMSVIRAASPLTVT